MRDNTARYGGAVAPLSSSSAAPMAGPMQAKKDKDIPGDETAKKGKKRKSLKKRIMNTFGNTGRDKDIPNETYDTKFDSNVSNPGNNTSVAGLNHLRMLPEFTGEGGSFGSEKTDDEIMEMYLNP